MQNVCFVYDREIYQQKDGVSIRPPHGPILCNIFMAELGITIITTVNYLLMETICR